MKLRGSFCKTVKAPKTAFDKRSFRWKKSGKAWVLVGCPKGKWSPKSATCKTGSMRAHEVSGARERIVQRGQAREEVSRRGPLSAMMAEQRKREKARAVADKACKRYGVFVWTGENRYPIENVIGGKLYKSEKLASKSAAAQENGGHGRAVRSVDVCTNDEKKAIFEKLIYGEPLGRSRR